MGSGAATIAALQRSVGNRGLSRALDDGGPRIDDEGNSPSGTSVAGTGGRPDRGRTTRSPAAKGLDDAPEIPKPYTGGGAPPATTTPTAGAAPPCSVKRAAPLAPGLDDDTWGLTQPEYVKVAFTARRDGAAWVPSVTGLVGHYSIQTHLPGRQKEVTGPGGNTKRRNYCKQVGSLRALGRDDRRKSRIGPWFMEQAVERHEAVHEAHLLPALQSARTLIVRSLEAISVPIAVAADANAAEGMLEADPAFGAAVEEAKVTWEMMLFDHVLDDHFSGATDAAERKVVDPMIDSICQAAAAQGWPACPACNHDS